MGGSQRGRVYMHTIADSRCCTAELTQQLLHSKGNDKQGEKTALRLGENNSK